MTGLNLEGKQELLKLHLLCILPITHPCGLGLAPGSSPAWPMLMLREALLGLELSSPDTLFWDLTVKV